MNTNAIIPGSLSAVAAQDHKSIAETFINADCIIVVDTSGSMDACDSRGNKSRYDVACEELKNLQGSMPGKLAVIAFSSDVIFCPSGVPFQYHGGTNLAGALKFTKVADVSGMRFIVISDGDPDDESEALKVARTYKAKIDTIFVGPEGGHGQEFLRKLAKASGGQGVTAAQVNKLKDKVETLLLQG